MKKSKVFVKKNLTYESERIRESIYFLVNSIKLNVRNKKVLIKPNLLMASSPDECICTHYEVVTQLADVLKNFGAHVIVAESSGGADNFGKTKKACEVSGLLASLKQYNIPFINIDEYPVSLRKINGSVLKEIPLTNLLDEVDFIISVPKMKTHVLTLYTGAIKNLMGLIPGSGKLKMHRIAPSSKNLEIAIIDLFKYIKPHFTVMDAVWAMEGDGPNQGMKREVGFLLASDDLVALDSVATIIMGFKEGGVFHIKYANELGLGNYRLKDIDLIGDAIVQIPDFKKSFSFISRNVPDFLLKTVSWLLKSYPVIDNKICIKCGKCRMSCPVGAISDDFIIDNSKCINCLCCHELCPEDAVYIKKSRLLKLLG